MTGLKMKTVKTESTIFCDVDDTLVMWRKAKKGDKVVAVTNPHSGEQNYLVVHKGHVRVLKDRKSRGAHIVVWSAGGYAWAEAVVKALGLEEHVDLIMSKPLMYIDDKKAKHFMGEHLYIPYGDGYGR